MYRHIGSGRVWRVLWIGWVALALLAGCGGLAPGQQRPGIGGYVVGVDDTGLPDHPLAGRILAIPRKEGIAWVRASHPRLPVPAWRTAVVPFTRPQIEGLGGVIVDADEAGDFWLPVCAGNYVICYARSSASTVVLGCKPLTLPDQGTIRATLGEGGFNAQLE